MGDHADLVGPTHVGRMPSQPLSPAPYPLATPPAILNAAKAPPPTPLTRPFSAPTPTPAPLMAPRFRPTPAIQSAPAISPFSQDATGDIILDPTSDFTLNPLVVRPGRARTGAQSTEAAGPAPRGMMTAAATFEMGSRTQPGALSPMPLGGHGMQPARSHSTPSPNSPDMISFDAAIDRADLQSQRSDSFHSARWEADYGTSLDPSSPIRPTQQETA